MISISSAVENDGENFHNFSVTRRSQGKTGEWKWKCAPRDCDRISLAYVQTVRLSLHFGRAQFYNFMALFQNLGHGRSMP